MGHLRAVSQRNLMRETITDYYSWLFFTSFDTNKQVDIAILDFSKAFDTVPQDRLLHKLNQYGITWDLHQWLTTFLTHRQMTVHSNRRHLLRSNNCRLRSSAGNNTRSLTILMPHEWPTLNSQTRSKAIRRWLPTMQRNKRPKRSPYTTKWLEEPRRMGEHKGHEV